jgi:hypothetical protein
VSAASDTQRLVGSRGDVVAAGAVALCALLLSWGPLTDLDWGWHLATFERWVGEGRLPVDDRFAWGSRGPYEPVHLVFQLGVGSSHRLLGLPGVVVWRELLCVAFGLALWATLRRQGASRWTAVGLVGVALAAAEFRLSARPHLFTFLGVVLLLDTLLAIRDRGLRRPLRLLALFAVWANAHPGVVYGVALAWGFAGVELARAVWAARGGSPAPLDRPAALRLVGWVAAGTAATCLNPLGLGLYPYLLEHRGMQSQLDVAELRGLFQHPERGTGPHVLLAGLFLAGSALAARRWRRLDPTLVLATAAFAVLGVVLARSGPLALVLLSVVLAPALGTRLPAWALAAALLVPGATAAQRLTTRPGGLLFPGRYGVRAADWLLEQRPRGRIYNTNALGGYLVYRLAPEGLRVHTDGRMPLFLDALVDARDWPAFEARERPEVVVLDWGPSPRAAYEPELDEGFRARYALVHVSNGAKVYLRKEAGNDGLIARYAYQQLRYVGRLWTRAPEDPERFRAEVQRARREAPELRLLPPG